MMYRAYFDKFLFDDQRIVCYESQPVTSDGLGKIWERAGYHKTKREAVNALMDETRIVLNAQTIAIHKELDILDTVSPEATP